MKVSSPYPVLDNRPIDQWKVTELKEELKRRKLPLRGLKEDLVKRLDEAIREENESAMENADEGVDGTPQPVFQAEENESAMENADEGVDGTPQPVFQAEENESAMENADEGVDGTPQPVFRAVENVSAMENADEGVDGTPRPVFQAEDSGTASVVFDTTVDMMNDGDKIDKVDGGINHANDDETALLLGEGKVQGGEVAAGPNSAMDEEMVLDDTHRETGILIEDSVVSELAVNLIESQNNDSQNRSGDLKSELENEIKPPHEAIESNPSDPNNQVSEVSTVLGFQVKSDSISTDCVSTNEKIELKDNIIVGNVKLELDVKPEMVQPSSSNVFPDGGKLHPMDVEVLHGKKLSVEEEDDTHVAIDEMSNKNDSADVVSSEKLNLDRSSGDDSMEDDALESTQRVSNYNSDEVVDMKEKMEVSAVKVAPADVMQDDIPGENEDIQEENNDPPAALTVKTKLHEKLNLDQSSGDKSIEEDASESKPIVPKYSSDEVVDGKVKTEVPVVVEAAPANDVRADISVDNEDSHDAFENAPAAPTVKRTLHDQEVVGKNETPKRQRRWWNSENLKVPEPQSSIPSSTTPKDVFPSATLKRNFSRSNSAASDDAPKERTVPPSPKPPTNSLRIDRFLRPFTIKAVQELLGKNGTVSSFWMDHIKTHCYVTYSSVEEAIATRNAVYNLQWPSNGGRLLVAEFVDPQEVKIRAEDPPQAPSTPVTPGPIISPPATLQPEPSPRQLLQKEKLPLPPPLPPPPPLSNPPQARERLPLPPPPPLSNPSQARKQLPLLPPEKVDPPIVTLDDLFKKTKATPRIYYLPLSDEQVAAKLKAQGKTIKQ